MDAQLLFKSYTALLQATCHGMGPLRMAGLWTVWGSRRGATGGGHRLASRCVATWAHVHLTSPKCTMQVLTRLAHRSSALRLNVPCRPLPPLQPSCQQLAAGDGNAPLRPPTCLVHVIDRSSPFSGFDDMTATGEQGDSDVACE